MNLKKVREETLRRLLTDLGYRISNKKNTTYWKNDGECFYGFKTDTYPPSYFGKRNSDNEWTKDVADKAKADFLKTQAEVVKDFKKPKQSILSGASAGTSCSSGRGYATAQDANDTMMSSAPPAENRDAPNSTGTSATIAEGRSGNASALSPKIAFSAPYPKLTLRDVGDTFTTIRFGDKEDYYLRNLSSTFVIVVKDSPLYLAQLDSVERTIIDKLSEELIKKDTYEHYTKHDFLTLMRNFYGRKESWNEGESVIIVLNMRVTKVI